MESLVFLLIWFVPMLAVMALTGFIVDYIEKKEPK